MGKSTYESFRGLLRGAICTKKQAVFAKDAGISPEHLNRMLNANEINRPSKQTLMKIAAVASNGITYDDFVKALDKEDPDYHEETVEEMKLAEARDDFKMSFEEKADKCFEFVKESIDKIMSRNNAQVVSDLNDVMEEVVDEYKLKCETIWDMKNVMFSYDIGPAREYFGYIYDDVTHWASVILSLAEGVDIAESTIIMYFSYVPKANILVMQHMSMALKDIIELYGYPISGLEFWQKKGLSEEDAMAAVSSEDYEFKLSNSITKSAAARFFSWLNNPGKNRKVETIRGFGFAVTEIPKNFARFVTTHKDSVLNAYKTNTSEYELVKRGLEDLIEQNASNEAFAEVLNQYHSKMSEAKGWQEAISRVMRLETGFSFFNYTHQDPDDNFPEISTDDYVMIDEDERIKLGIHETTLIAVTCKYAKQLGLEYFGDYEFKYVFIDDWPENRRKKRFKINYEDGMAVSEDADTKLHDYVSLKDTIPEDENVNWVSVDDRLPEQAGMYWVLLKDGREYQMFYLASKKHWIAKHVEWSSFVSAWDSASAITDIKEDEAQQWIDDYDKDWNDDVK